MLKALDWERFTNDMVEELPEVLGREQVWFVVASCAIKAYYAGARAQMDEVCGI